MNTTKLILTGLTLTIAFAWSLPADVPTNQAFKVSMSLTTAYRDDTNPAKIAVKKAKIATENIINLAIGQSPTNAVPANLALALIISCNDSQGFLAVVNTVSHTVVAPIAELNTDGITGTTGSGAAGIISDGWHTTNSLPYYITSGWLSCAGKVLLDPSPTNACPLKSLSLGSMSGIFYGTDNGTNITIVITGGKLQTVAPLGYIPAP